MFGSFSYTEMLGLTYREAVEYYDFYNDYELEKLERTLDAIRIYIAESVSVALSDRLPALLAKKNTGALSKFVAEIKKRSDANNEFIEEPSDHLKDQFEEAFKEG